MLFTIDILSYALMGIGGAILFTGFLTPLGIILLVVGSLMQTVSQMGLEWPKYNK